MQSNSSQNDTLGRRIVIKLTEWGLGLRGKLVLLFTLARVLPLILLAWFAWSQVHVLGGRLGDQANRLAHNAMASMESAGNFAINDAIESLNLRATAELERMSTDTALAVADFLYGRDSDILFAASLKPSEETYRNFISNKQGRMVKPGKWALTRDGKEWHRVDAPESPLPVRSSNHENDHSFHYRAPDSFEYENRPLYLEMTFVDLEGKEQVKVTTSPIMDAQKRDVSDRRNTFVRAETYFSQLARLRPGDIHVSDVIGAYVGTNFIGMYTPQNLAANKLEYAPEKQAYAGMENPNGIRFKGLVRWATPVVREGRIIGYVTLALNHDHIMEFVDRLTPSDSRYTELPNAFKGNYAFIWDHKGRSICHPRHHSIVGYDPETGDPQIPWLEASLYAQWQASGLPYASFIEEVPTFQNQSNNKKPAVELTKKGLVGLDCRYLNFAPQCTGWFDLTENGGSGSFRIFWSGLWKLNTAAAIPYYTGQYGKSRRGFGFVAVGAGMEDFTHPATVTKESLQKFISHTGNELGDLAQESAENIQNGLRDTAMNLSVFSIIMEVTGLCLVVWVAALISRRVMGMVAGIARFRAGERHFRFNAPIKDEMGALADSFDSMAESLVKSDSGPVTIVDPDGIIRFMNEHGLSLIGRKLEDVLGKPYADYSIFPTGTNHCPLECHLHGTEARAFKNEKNGRFYQGNVEDLADENGVVIGHVVNVVDVTNTMITHTQNEQFRQELESEHTLVECIQLLSHADQVNEAIDQVLVHMGRFYSSDRAYIMDTARVGEPRVLDRMHEWHLDELQDIGNSRDEFPAIISRSSLGLINDTGELTLDNVESIRKDYPELYQFFNEHSVRKFIGVPLYAAGSVHGFICVCNPRRHGDNLTLLHSLAHFIGIEFSKRQAMEVLRDLGMRDNLTGLGNRNAYLNEVEQLKTTRGSSLGVVFIDMNNLKYVNDTYGHEKGDEYITTLTGQFQNHFRSRDIFRIGGDEFVLLCQGMPEYLFLGKVAELEEGCNAAIPHAVSLGHAWHGDATKVEYLVREADQKMYVAKQAIKREYGTRDVEAYFGAPAPKAQDGGTQD